MCSVAHTEMQQKSECYCLEIYHKNTVIPLKSALPTVGPTKGMTNLAPCPGAADVLCAPCKFVIYMIFLISFLNGHRFSGTFGTMKHT